MKEKIEMLQKEAETKIEQIKDDKELQDLKVKILGKKSELSNLLKSLGNLSPEERPKVRKSCKWGKNKIRNKIKRSRRKNKSQNLRGKIRKINDRYYTS